MKTTMKPYLRVLAFFAGLLMLFVLTSYIFIPKNNSEEAGMDEARANGFLGEPDDTLDVLIVGDSLTYCSFSPMLMWQDYGFTSYVAGTSAQPVYESVLFIEKALRTQKPSAVILETNTIFRETTTRNYIASKVKDLLPLFHYHDRWKGMTLQDFGGGIDYTWTDDLKGFRYKTGIDAGTNLDYMAYSEEKAPIPKSSMLSLQDILKLCEEYDVPLMLVSAPCMKYWTYPKHNTMQAFADEHGLVYLDLNLLTDEFGLDWSVDTLDKGDHLNYQGASKLSAYFGKYLQEKLGLPDHREDLRYAPWNDALVRYQDLVSKPAQENG